MKTDWPARHPLVMIAIISVILTVFIFILGIIVVISGWQTSEQMAERVVDPIFSLPMVIYWCLVYRYLTTGQIRNVQAKETDVDPRKQEQDPIAPQG